MLVIFYHVLLNEKQDQDTNIFLTKCFNWNYSRDDILHHCEPIFYGCKGEKFFGKIT